MDMFGSYYSEAELIPGVQLEFWSPTSSSSEAAAESSSDNGTSRGMAVISDEQVILASNSPKKRAGRKKFRETRRRDSGKWVCEVREPNKKSRIWLGTFATAEMAARAHDVAAIALRGRSACLNFADSTWRLPIPASSSAQDIRKAAVEAAEAFHPREEAATVNSLSMDDEGIFGMQGLLFNMAEGLMLPPPLYSHDVEVDAAADDMPLILWSYSI